MMPVNVRLTQIDGELPNLALMRLAHFYRATGDHVVLTRSVERGLFEPAYDLVYGSSIFDFSGKRREIFRSYFPDAVLGGTGTIFKNRSIEEITGTYEHYEYADYPDFNASIGYTQRGCRMAGPKSPCRSFCEVPDKEGFPKAAGTIASIWRGKPWPKKIHLLDNDFFGGPEWHQRVDEIVAGKFRICFSQGINTRLITPETARAMASIQYRDTKFKERRLYTAWDNIGDERVFLKGVDCLNAAGVPSKHLMVYMLIGNDITETWERIWSRFKRMVDVGMQPYPMVKDRGRKDLLCFQRWVITGLYRIIPWPDYERETKTEASLRGWEAVYAG
jgi:hypothetical protein